MALVSALPCTKCVILNKLQLELSGMELCDASLCICFIPLTGCKIKALRAKTNTYIKTPVRGEQPVFVVTGRKEDVAMAKREILSAAEHFSLIRASRNKAGPLTAATGPGNPSLPGQTTIQVSGY